VADDEFGRVYARLRGLLEPYARRLHVSGETATTYGVDMAPPEERDPTTWFAGVRRGKRYVSYYLMPVYVEPSLLDGISSELRRRMQGKSCFNFTKIDEPLLAELAELTRTGYEATGGDRRWGAAKRSAREGSTAAHGRAR
jgi:hypothetical protein